MNSRSVEELAGKVILITGAGAGLGKAFALDAARHGATIFVNDLNETAYAVASEICAAGGQASAHIAAMGPAGTAQAVVDACIKRFGRIDGLIANAGIMTQADATAMSAERIDEIITVNLAGVIHTGVAALRYMKAAGRGAIVNIVSGAMLGMPELSIYGASKGGVLSLTHAWAREMEGSAVHVHGLSPYAQTAMMAQSTGYSSASTPDDIAPLATFLLSDRAIPLNGRTLRLAHGQLHFLTPAEYGPSLGARTSWDMASIEQAVFS